MYVVSFKDLHKEHLEWLSSIKIWRDELTFLTNLLNSKLQNSNTAEGTELVNNLSHHQTLLKSMERQIHSHESFIKEMLEMGVEDFEQSSTNDHDHNRDHMESFQKSFTKLKKVIFQRTSHPNN